MDDSRRQAYLGAMGVQLWELREIPSGCAPAAVPDALGAEAEADTVGALDWEALRARVAQCSACGLHAARTQTVFGVGDIGAQLMLVGEAPGAEEDRQGEPFVGKAGKLLNEMLRAIGLERGGVYIANILKCRPPNNRDPQAEEVACCEPYLRRQVELVRPRVIVALGRIAAQNLLKTGTSLGRLRGQRHSYGSRETPVLVTYHPAYLLRSPQEKRKAWQDLCTIRSLLTAEDDRT